MMDGHGSMDGSRSTSLRSDQDGHGALPPLTAEELASNISELQKRLNRRIVCFAGQNQVYIRSVILDLGKTSTPRIAMKCAIRKRLKHPPDVYFEYIRDVCCGDPTACPAHQQFRAGRSM